MTRHPRTCAALLCLAIVSVPRGVRAQQATPSPSASPSPSATPGPAPSQPFHLDLDRHVDEAVKKLEGDLPRFQESVEVIGKTPQVMIERFFGGLDLECGPAVGGAPTDVETREFRPHTAPTADFLSLATALAQMFKSKGKGKPGTARYFLYRIRHGHEVTYSLRDGRVPDSWFYNTSGTTYELLETFDDPKAAAQAYLRMERGFAVPVPTTSSYATPVYQTIPCRPRR